jgi:hypothetical protein
MIRKGNFETLTSIGRFLWTNSARKMFFRKSASARASPCIQLLVTFGNSLGRQTANSVSMFTCVGDDDFDDAGRNVCLGFNLAEAER